MILLDSSYLVALFNSSDSQHSKAKSIQSKLAGSKLLLTEYIVLELSTVLAMRATVEQAKFAIDSLLEAQEVTFLGSNSIFSDTLTRMMTQSSFQLSFVDCSLLVLLDSGQASHLVTFDTSLSLAAEKYLFKFD